MSPVPIIRAIIGALRDFVCNFFKMILPGALVCIGTAAAVVGLSGVKLPHKKGTLGTLIHLLPQPALAILFMCAVSALLLSVDRTLYGVEHESFMAPFGRVAKMVIFIGAVVIGMLSIIWLGFVALAPRLSGHLGLAPLPAGYHLSNYNLVNIPSLPQAHQIIASIVLVIFLPLLFRLLLLFPVMILDKLDVGPSWTLVLKTMRGKTVPLLVALSIQLCVVAIFSLIANELFKSLPAAGTVAKNIAPTPILELLLICLVLGIGAALVATLQVTITRHFFGVRVESTQAHMEVEDAIPQVFTPAATEVSANFESPSLPAYQEEAAVEEVPYVHQVLPEFGSETAPMPPPPEPVMEQALPPLQPQPSHPPETKVPETKVPETKVPETSKSDEQEENSPIRDPFAGLKVEGTDDSDNGDPFASLR